MFRMFDNYLYYFSHADIINSIFGKNILVLFCTHAVCISSCIFEVAIAKKNLLDQTLFIMVFFSTLIQLFFLLLLWTANLLRGYFVLILNNGYFYNSTFIIYFLLYDFIFRARIYYKKYMKWSGIYLIKLLLKVWYLWCKDLWNQ